MEKGTYEVKIGLAEMLKGGVIMDVTTPEQAKISDIFNKSMNYFDCSTILYPMLILICKPFVRNMWLHLQYFGLIALKVPLLLNFQINSRLYKLKIL